MVFDVFVIVFQPAAGAEKFRYCVPFTKQKYNDMVNISLFFQSTNNTNMPNIVCVKDFELDIDDTFRGKEIRNVGGNKTDM